MTETHVRRCDTLSLIGLVDKRHTLRLLPDGTLGLLRDPKNRRGGDYECEIIATAPATRREAIALALQVLKRADRLTSGLLNAIRLRLGETPTESISKAAAYFGIS